MNNITYIFSGGRIVKANNKNYSDDFFYGYRFLKNKNLNINVIEFEKKNYFFERLSYYFSKYSSLPLSLFSILSLQNLKILKKTDNLILVNESVGFSALIPLIYLKKKHKIKTHLIVMGLFSKQVNYKILKKLHYQLIVLLIKYIDRVYFLGKKEHELASRIITNKKKLIFSPFCVHYDFWKSQNIDLSKNEYILFIGNDGNRDIDLLVKIAREMKDKKFVFISSNYELLDSKLKNVKIINGNWKSDNLSDIDIKKFYENSRLIILPLKESSQPSGQSVALQAMSVGVPVMISKTEGFWDSKNFKDQSNILFQENNDYKYWIKNINSIYSDIQLLNHISKNATMLVEQKYNIQSFNNFLLEEVVN